MPTAVRQTRTCQRTRDRIAANARLFPSKDCSNDPRAGLGPEGVCRHVRSLCGRLPGGRLGHGPVVLPVSGRRQPDLRADGKTVIGSELIAQRFESDRLLPPATVRRRLQGGRSRRLEPGHRTTLTCARRSPDGLKAHQATPSKPAPVDLVTASGSGLDPDISPEAALYQAPARRPTAGFHRKGPRLIDRHTNRSAAILGAPPRVNVLLLNLALDKEPSAFRVKRAR